jgi:hypothetical protein
VNARGILWSQRFFYFQRLSFSAFGIDHDSLAAVCPFFISSIFYFSSDQEGGTMHVYLKAEILKKFGSQIVAARQMEIPESNLSRIVRGHREPSDRERGALEKAFGTEVLREVLDGQ